MFNLDRMKQAFKVLLLFTTTSLFASEANDFNALKAKLFVVHASDTFPSSGFFPAGKEPYSDSKKELTRQLYVSKSTADARIEYVQSGGGRPFTYVSIGELVRPFGEYSWEKKQVAYIAPFEVVESQIYNIDPYDTALIGALQVTQHPRSCLIVSQDVRADLDDDVLARLGDINLCQFNPHEETLRSVVEQKIQEYGGTLVRLRTDIDKLEKEKVDAICEGINICKKDFWLPFLQLHPNIYWGNHSQTPTFLIDKVGYVFKPGIVLSPRDEGYIPESLLKLIKPVCLWSLQQETIRIRELMGLQDQAKASFLENVNQFFQFLGQPPIDEQEVPRKFKLVCKRFLTQSVQDPLTSSDVIPTLVRCTQECGNSMNTYLDRMMQVFRHTLIHMNQNELAELIQLRFQSDSWEKQEAINYSRILFTGYCLVKFIDITERLSTGRYANDAEMQDLQVAQASFATNLVYVGKRLPKGAFIYNLFITFLRLHSEKELKPIVKSFSDQTRDILTNHKSGPIKALLGLE